MGVVYDTPCEDEVLNRLKALAFDHLPDGWRDWPLTSVYEPTFDIDQQCLNKLRFALPTVGIATAFSPQASSLPEKAYRNMKRTMMQWPFCRGLVIAPRELALRLRGSHAGYELVSKAVAPMKPLFLSRTDASAQLGGSSGDTPPPQLRRSDTPESGASKDLCLEALDARMVRMEGFLETIASQLQHRPPHQELPMARPSPPRRGHSPRRNRSPSRDRSSRCRSPRPRGRSARRRDSSVSSDDSDRAYSLPDEVGFDYSDHDGSCALPPAPSVTESAPSTFQAPALTVAPPARPFSFVPATTEVAPLVAPPDDALRTQALTCQKLGSASWDKIRYLDAQKKLQAGDLFQPLLVNPSLHSSASSASDAARKEESLLGLLTHGLLLQRKHFSDGINEVVQSHPDAADALVKVFASADAPFRTTSDDLLQFVCGKRAEVIAARRKVLESSNAAFASHMRDIPPSSVHLYDDDRLSALLRQPPPVASTSAPAATFRHLRRKPAFQSSRRATGRKDTKVRYAQPARTDRSSRTSHVRPDSKRSKGSGTARRPSERPARRF